MKAPSISLLLGLPVLLFGLVVSAVFLNVSQNRQLFFRRDSVSLSCVEDGQTVDGWTVKRTAGGQTQTCGGGQQDFGRINGTSCIIPTLFPTDTGVYWCETRAGQRSAQVNISVSDRSVILELPKLPVIAGSDVTLHCKTRDSATQTVYFFRNGSFLGTGFTGEFTISDVQRSHEGLYSCSTGLFSESTKSWLSVRDPHPDSALSVVRLLCHLVVICPYCISTILMVSIYCSKRTAQQMRETFSSS
ncbi:uncharacterized protein LOC122875246 isoform X2 [Siniperca chuatsi]|uniref:uncharacterized protein LOC122875246 isoform X2 n=1 Tax=Siniperca chuatsi TaxID=119488 RepID=UPI001CE0973E|nr:uncharacterized protein LOC122875246 isoform X2 [Siniperca chuatsi]